MTRWAGLGLVKMMMMMLISDVHQLFIQIYFLVCLTASEASPLFMDVPNMENLVDDFWDYFFFIMVGLPLDPGTWSDKKSFTNCSVDCEMSSWSQWSPCMEACYATRHQT